MPKKYTRINWEDAPSTNTPRNALFFNKMDKGIDDIDNAVIDVQNQLDQLVIDGDSSPAIAQALAGTEFSTLKQYRENNDAQLAQIGNLNDLETDSNTDVVSAVNENTEQILAIKNNYTIPTIPNLADKKIEIVAGTVRQDTTDRTKWYYINNSAHTPVGVSGDYAVASGSGLTVTFAKTYTKVISFIACTDETLANTYQCTVGGSVGLNNTILQMSGRINGDAIIRYDGASWVYTNTTGAEIVTGISASGANITVTHSFCPGGSVVLIPYTNNGAVIPYIPVLKTASSTEFTMNFINPTTGNFVSVHDTKMCFKFSKVFNDGFLLDGTGGYNAVPLNDGNIWFYGIFEV